MRLFFFSSRLSRHPRRTTRAPRLSSCQRWAAGRKLSFDVLEDRRMLSVTTWPWLIWAISPTALLIMATSQPALNASDIGFSAQSIPVGTATRLTVSPTPLVSGSTVTLMATVIGPSGWANPPGSVTFMDGSATLGTSNLGYIYGTVTSPYAAVFYASNLTLGLHSFTADYDGDIGLCSRAAAARSAETVYAPSAVTFVVSPSPCVFGQQVTFTASVSSTQPGPAAPKGTVTFTDGGATLGTSDLTCRKRRDDRHAQHEQPRPRQRQHRSKLLRRWVLRREWRLSIRTNRAGGQRHDRRDPLTHRSSGSK